MPERSVLYFRKGGAACTREAVRAAARRAAELRLTHAVAATTSGRTALELVRALRAAGSPAHVIGVAYAANFAAQWGRLQPKHARPAEKLGARFICGGHALGGVNGAVRDKLGGATPNTLIANTYYTFGQGMKVAVEVAVMAADQGLLPTGRKVLALGGSGAGADTALVLTPACSAEFFSLRIHEILCMPG